MNELSLKENMIRIIENDIIKYKEYLFYFSLNPENYSKSLQLDLEEFSKRIKESEEFFSTIERNKLIFTHNETFYDSDRIKNVNTDLNLIKFNLENIKIKLSSLRKNLDKYCDEKILLSDSKNYLFNLSEFSYQFKKFIPKPDDIKNDECKNENIDYFFEKVKHIKEIRSKIKEKEEMLQNCQKDLRIYKGLPKDIIQIKEMIKNKKIELEYL